MMHTRVPLPVLVLSLALISGVASAVEVSEIWQRSCSKCHGMDGKGDTKLGKKLEIKDFTDAKYQATLKDEEMVKAIFEGLKDGEKIRMKPVDGVTEAEAKELVKFVRSLKK